jgi:serine/threonine-protein kinase
VTRFYNEVRIARQVSHPSVCRVYDIGELEGQHYLSMEYVDGEDLASLLRRIGRLPEDKALEVSRQLCAGLAAAHERGVLHRDLKPGNIMIDGRGKVRITDFGLAVLADEAHGKDVRAGTPAYMAPEQLSGAEVTTRSDIYALGAVLYELFTGKRAFHANTLAEITREQQSLPASPVSIIEDLDPAIERAILRCLEKEPRQRPASALQVAASLPGGDPLAAALAAGEVPSPEMVAAAGVTGSLGSRRAWGLLGACVAALALVVHLSGGFLLINRVPCDKPPAVLADRASDLLHKLGYNDRPADTKSGFAYDEEYLDWVKKHDRSPDRWKDLASGRPAALYFWYRQSPRYMRPSNSFMEWHVQHNDPPQLFSGMATLSLDGNGRLLGMRIEPPQREPGKDAAKSENPSTSPGVTGTAPLAASGGLAPDWSMLISEAGFDPKQLTPAASTWVPPMYCDMRAAWVGTYPDRADRPLRIEAGAYAGRPVYFKVIRPWTRAQRMEVKPSTRGGKVAQAIGTGLVVMLLVGSVLRARHNLRLGLGDRRGAWRLATYTFAVFLLDFLLDASHAPSVSEEWDLLFPALGLTLFFATLLWILYVALEPSVRKQWPDSIISWSRVLAGRFRDPLVGRDILLGCFAGCALILVSCLRHYIPGWIGEAPPQPAPTLPTSLRGLGASVSLLFLLQPQAAFNPMALLFMLVFLRYLLRNRWLALIVLAAIFVVLLSAELDNNLKVDVPVVLAIVAIWLTILLRLGLLAMIVTSFVYDVLILFPLTSDPSHWYAGASLLAVATVVVLTLYGFYTARSGRPLFRGVLLPDRG